MKYLRLAYEEEGKLNALSRGDWDLLRRETLEYVEELRQAGYLIAAEPLRSVKTAATVRVCSGKLSLTDGPFAETKETLGPPGDHRSAALGAGGAGRQALRDMAMKCMLLVYLDEIILSEAQREACYRDSVRLARDLDRSCPSAALHQARKRLGFSMRMVSICSWEMPLHRIRGTMFSRMCA
jgi:YCII-related domain